jgi:hypothetical protein
MIEPRAAVLKWQVVETTPIASWVIAAFDLEDHAIAIALTLQSAADPLETYTVREDPAWVTVMAPARRELFRPDTVSELLAERDV